MEGRRGRTGGKGKERKKVGEGGGTGKGEMLLPGAEGGRPW